MRMVCLGALALALSWAAAGPVYAERAAVAGVVIVVQGKPQVKKAGKADSGPLKLNSFIYEGDLITTGEGDRATVAFVGGAEVRLAGGSTFVVESGGGQEPTRLRTQWGQLWTRLLHGKAGINIHTPNATAAVRGTEADIEATRQLTVKVYEGLVDVFNDKGRQSLTAGQMTQVADAQSAPQAPRQMGAADKGNWQDALQAVNAEKQIERLRAAAEKNRSVDLELNKGGQKKKLKLQLHKK